MKTGVQELPFHISIRININVDTVKKIMIIRNDNCNALRLGLAESKAHSNKSPRIAQSGPRMLPLSHNAVNYDEWHELWHIISI